MMAAVGETVVLAYSGGLDTSCILKWLLEKKYRVVCYMANIGQDEDFEAACQKARKIGATEVVIDDVREEFVREYVLPAIQMGLIYEGRYLLGTSLARPCIARGLVRCCQKYGARIISHGATGKGNDQVRFELSCYALDSNTRMLAPWREDEFVKRFAGRQELLHYAKQNGIPVPVTPSAPFSMDANLMHVSYESGILENPALTPTSDMYAMTKSPMDAPDKPTRISVTFQNGIPITLNLVDENREIKDPLEILMVLNKIAGKAGIGRIDIVENRFVGLKSRGVYETPACTVLQAGHLDLELVCLDREVLRTVQTLRNRMADVVYNGFWFSPEGIYVRSCLTLSQRNVSGTVHMDLYKGNVIILARTSDKSLYNADLVSMDKHDEFSPSDATGFINIHAIRLKEYYRLRQSNK